jgi:hypothetical protein
MAIFWFYSVISTSCLDSTSISLRLFHFRALAIHHSFIIAPSDSIYCYVGLTLLGNIKERSPSWETVGCAATQEFPSIFGTRRFIWQEPSTGRYPEPDRSSPYHSILSQRFILVVFTHLRLSLPSGLFSPGLFTNILYAFLLLSSVLHTLSISSSSTLSF